MLRSAPTHACRALHPTRRSACLAARVRVCARAIINRQSIQTNVPIAIHFHDTAMGSSMSDIVCTMCEEEFENIVSITSIVLSASGTGGLSVLYPEKIYWRLPNGQDLPPQVRVAATIHVSSKNLTRCVHSGSRILEMVFG